MTGTRAESFVVLALRVLAASFALVGVVFLAAPDGVLETLADVGDELGEFAAPPETMQQLWLALGFAYMTVITGICLVVSLDVVRYRAFLLVLAVGKAASSLASLGFYLFDLDVFAWLLNFVVDGALAVIAVWLWSLAGRVGRPAAPS